MTPNTAVCSTNNTFYRANLSEECKASATQQIQTANTTTQTTQTSISEPEHKAKATIERLTAANASLRAEKAVLEDTVSELQC